MSGRKYLLEVYATCLFCSGALGRNESLEHFPVGRRLAFDAAKGRLWVVCPACARWNLTPLDARWEAIEEAERWYRDTRLRASTDHVGLAKLKDGTELVRIGRPLLPEFAAWRYGDVFKTRWRKSVLIAAGMTAVPWFWLGGRLVDTVIASSATISLVTSAFQIAHPFVQSHLAKRVRAAIPDARGNRWLVSRLDAASSEVRFDGQWHVDLQYREFRQSGRLLRAIGIKKRSRTSDDRITVHGDEATRAVSMLLPLVNHDGARNKTIADAVTLASEVETVDALLKDNSPAVGWAGVRARGTYKALTAIPAAARLAMEMRLHEEDERHALEGELGDLEDRWREAEEIANIADRMFLPADLDDRLAALRTR